MQSQLRVAASWLVAVLGFLIGLFALVKFGMWWLPLGDHEPGWFLRWLSVLGIGLFGLGFLIGSIVALRNPKRAGTIFLVFLPVATFCLAYPESGFLVWHTDGSGWFESPLPLTAVALTMLFFLPFVTAAFLRQHKKRAAIALTMTVLVGVPVFVYSRWTSVLVPQLVGFSAPFFLFGAFWLGTLKLGWPALLEHHSRTRARRIAAAVVACLVVFCLIVVMTLGSAAMGSSLFSGDCREKQPVTHPESPYHAVFTARAILVGRSMAELEHEKEVERLNGFRPVAEYRYGFGEWAIGVVQDRFWGIPSHWPHLVLLTNFVYREGETYFIDGERGHGFFTRILPIVGARIGCSRSRPVQDAAVDLRLLREAQPESGTLPKSR